MLVRLGRMGVGFRGVFRRCRLIALLMMIRCGAMGLCSLLVVFGSGGMGSFGHHSFLDTPGY